MFPVLAIATATIGLLLILALIFREVKDDVGSTEKGALAGGAVLAIAVSVWQVIAHWPGGGAH